MSDRKARIERTASAAVGVPVEVTVRGDREFTFSAEGNVVDRLTAFVKSLPGAIGVSGDYDLECDFTCVYFSA